MRLLPDTASSPQTVWCNHAGVLVFAPSLLAIAQVLDPPEARFSRTRQGLRLNSPPRKRLIWKGESRFLQKMYGTDKSGQIRYKIDGLKCQHQWANFTVCPSCRRIICRARRISPG